MNAFSDLELLLIDAAAALSLAQEAAKRGGYDLNNESLRGRLMDYVHELRKENEKKRLRPF